LCKSVGHHDVVISLRDRQAFGKALDCISGDFIADMTPCAPVGGYGLSAPTGNAPLGRVVERWQDYADHLGPVVGHDMTFDTIGFTGGYTSPQDGYKEDWSFFVSRLTGVGELKEKNKPPVTYSCAKAKQRF